MFSSVGRMLKTKEEGFARILTEESVLLLGRYQKGIYRDLVRPGIALACEFYGQCPPGLLAGSAPSVITDPRFLIASSAYVPPRRPGPPIVALPGLAFAPAVFQLVVPPVTYEPAWNRAFPPLLHVTPAWPPRLAPSLPCPVAWTELLVPPVTYEPAWNRGFPPLLEAPPPLPELFMPGITYEPAWNRRFPPLIDVSAVWALRFVPLILHSWPKHSIQPIIASEPVWNRGFLPLIAPLAIDSPAPVEAAVLAYVIGVLVCFVFFSDCLQVYGALYSSITGVETDSQATEQNDAIATSASDVDEEFVDCSEILSEDQVRDSWRRMCNAAFQAKYGKWWSLLGHLDNMIDTYLSTIPEETEDELMQHFDTAKDLVKQQARKAFLEAPFIGVYKRTYTTKSVLRLMRRIDNFVLLKIGFLIDFDSNKKSSHPKSDWRILARFDISKYFWRFSVALLRRRPYHEANGKNLSGLSFRLGAADYFFVSYVLNKGYDDSKLMHLFMARKAANSFFTNMYLNCYCAGSQELIAIKARQSMEKKYAKFIERWTRETPQLP